MGYENIIYDKHDGIGYVTMNRESALNALNRDTLSELNDVFRQIDEDEDVRVAIITGNGRAFVAGADISQMEALDVIEGRDMTIEGQQVMELIESINKPVIAAINGFALGGGNELAMACDIRIASEKAKFGQPEVNLGIIPGFGGTQRLPRLVGKGMAKKLIYSADMIDAQEAYRIGLVDEVVPADKLMDAAEELAKKIMTKAPIAIKMAKIAVNNGANCDLKTGVQLEAEAYTGTFASEDRREGMRAFLEKREAQFKNK